MCKKKKYSRHFDEILCVETNVRVKKIAEKSARYISPFNYGIFTIVCRVAKVLWILTDSILSRAGSLAKSTAIITNIMATFTVTLFHFPRIVVAAVCTASLLAFGR